jgi:hypothetical protein
MDQATQITQITLIDAERAVAVPANIAGEMVRIAPDALYGATGWKLEPRGLCRGDVCVPVRERGALVDASGVDLASFARALGRPLALDVAERAAALGTAAAERSARMATLEAPDFTLPDLAGRMQSLSDHRGKKVLLIAYASW